MYYQPNQVAVTGPYGRVGSRLTGYGCIPLDFDVTKPSDFYAPAQTKLIIHTAAISDPDEAEKDKERTIQVNFRGTRYVVEFCEKYKLGMVLLSTDHVFNGARWGSGGYKEQDGDKVAHTAPVNHYGFCKWGAEKVTLGFRQKVIRTSQLFTDMRENPYVKSAMSGVPVQVPDFIVRSPMYMDDFVAALLQYSHYFHDMPDVLHLAGRETVSMYKFIADTVSLLGGDTRLVIPRKSRISTYTPRPENAGLNVERAIKLGFSLPTYKEGLQRWILQTLA